MGKYRFEITDKGRCVEGHTSNKRSLDKGSVGNIANDANRAFERWEYPPIGKLNSTMFLAEDGIARRIPTTSKGSPR